ncbi:MAG: hypothetical protein Q8922_09875 [Bacteroidota bacterium]|nr:hypothetical protein [Bacteroidota bacterium]MDP4232863.1 hypothetical protein [Bacteroidota bacterium]MDP4241907.1 hypothetical protein [Bacteroidota bacterium]MDP4288232.1 hypothetical protein [Bacteroidota bacterium]
MSSRLTIRIERWASFALVVLVIALFALQCSSLFVFPQPNSLRWYGDETWLMSEAKTQITTGTVRYPLAIGSTLDHSKGLALSMTWLSAVLYGLPAAAVTADPVAVGRVVTAVLAAILLVTAYRSARALGASSLAALIGVALLASTRAFVFSSHSCRTDLLAGLVVLLFLSSMTQLFAIQKERSQIWWIGYGAVVVFLAVSSSIHLLTLLGPVAIFLAWRFGGFGTFRLAFATIIGALSTLVLLTIVSWLTNGTLTLFTPGAHQFQDVLSSIPILRPLSRSVQSANILIRLKQFFAEAPAVFLLVLLTPFAWQSSKQRAKASSLLIALVIIFLSWLLFEGAEINYLMQVVPVIFLAIALALSRISSKNKVIEYAAAAIAIVFIGISGQDMLRASANAHVIDRSNASAISAIASHIDTSWHRPGAPLILVEPPALERMSQYPNLRVMTDHFISFSEREIPTDSFLRQEHVNYAVLYNSPKFPKDRARVDSLYRTVRRIGTLIAYEAGRSGDIGRNYFGRSEWQDTLLLFKLPE